MLLYPPDLLFQHKLNQWLLASLFICSAIVIADSNLELDLSTDFLNPEVTSDENWRQSEEEPSQNWRTTPNTTEQDRISADSIYENTTLSPLESTKDSNHIIRSREAVQQFKIDF